MKRHSMFEEVPAGLRFVAARDCLTTNEGYWVPVPVFWLVHGLRVFYIAYLRWSLRRKRGFTTGRAVIVCLKCGTHNEDDPEFYDLLRCWKCGNVLEREQ